MATHAARTAHTLLRPEGTSPVRYPPPRALIIEAHEDTRELYELWLTQRAFTVTATASGTAGLAAARAKAPDVIVAELMVPEGGVSLIRTLRAEPGCRDAIVVVLTTQTSASLRQHALEAGADVYLVKPCGVLHLGEVMTMASDHRSRLITPDISGGKPPLSRLRQAVRRSRAIRERLAVDVTANPVPPEGMH